ncbi:MAG: nuclear transport factor 2 family protein [Hydrogenophaga sp.]
MSGSPAAPAQPTPTAGDSSADVEAAVNAWAEAWSARNMSSYLGAYAANFTPNDGQSRKNWEAERKARIVPRSRIGVEVDDMAVSINGDRATVKFRQDYTSDTLNVTSRKTLSMVKSGGRWLIVREASGS